CVACDSDTPGGRLNEIVVATNSPWWLTDSGVVLGPKVAIADSGIIVDFDVDTDAPDDALDLPLAAIELSAWLRAESDALAAALCAAVPALDVPAEVATKVPAAALVVCVPFALPPDVLIHTWFSIYGLCQYFGATSI
ncbi:hypothetical protein M3215_23400, partial [Bacillus cytotoxicus]|nr:hypothetical protein [Bacillus cytotoxicus]